MEATLYDRIKNTKALRESRDGNKNYIISHPQHLPDLIHFAFNYTDADSHKACWILEFVAYEKPEWLQPHLGFFCENLQFLRDESAIRPIAKICQLLVTEHFKKNENGIQLSPEHLQKITEACFDWLIGDTKVAPKAYAMRTLFELGQHADWIIGELRTIVEKGYFEHSAAYKAAARDILKKMRHP